MHEFITEENGWINEILREDSDVGCFYLEQAKKNTEYEAKIRLTEHVRNELFTVQGLVYRRNGHTPKTLEEAIFLQEKEITGNGLTCKAEAVKYARGLKTEIDLTYFSNSC